MISIRLSQISSAAPAFRFVLCCGLALAIAARPPQTERPKSPAGALIVKDLLGQTHTFARLPQRIVFAANILPPYVTLTQNLAAVVGTTELGRRGLSSGFFNDIVKGADRLAIVGIGSTTAPNPELVLQLKPAAVVAWAVQTDVLNKTACCEVIGIRSSSQSAARDVSTWTLLGAISGQQQRATALLDRYRRQTVLLKSCLLAHLQQKTHVLVLVSNTKNLWIGNIHHALNWQLELVHAGNVARSVTAIRFSMEDVAKLNPDVILIRASSMDSLLPRIFYDAAVWQMIPAVRARKVYLIPEMLQNTVFLLDPLLHQWLAEVLHFGFAPCRHAERRRRPSHALSRRLSLRPQRYADQRYPFRQGKCPICRISAHFNGRGAQQHSR